jgi:hypothetical protein
MIEQPKLVVPIGPVGPTSPVLVSQNTREQKNKDAEKAALKIETNKTVKPPA